MTAAPAAYDVILAALAATLPCPQCGRTEPCRCLVEEHARPKARAALIEAALIEHGHLPAKAPPMPPDLRAAHYAQWLATESRHPRYVGGDGWKRILESEADVGVAATSAAKYATRTGEDEIQNVVGFLTSWIEQRQEREST